MRNKYQEHVYLIPEDDAIRQIANGFLLHPSVRTNRVQVLPVSGGWRRVLDDFEREYVNSMAKYPLRYLVLLIDLDNQQDRLQQVGGRIPDEYVNRVFILGIASESEDLKRAFGLSFENIGKALATDCRNNTNAFWGHELLKVNAQEIERMRERAYPILFDPG